jgi:hypothetical protein
MVATNDKTWGWTLMSWGIIMALAGLGLSSGTSWWRWFAIVVVFVYLIVQFGWFPAFPPWSIVVISLGAVVRVALTSH